jgi:hypothetical protein
MAIMINSFLSGTISIIVFKINLKRQEQFLIGFKARVRKVDKGNKKK